MNTSCFSARVRRWGAALLTALCVCAAPAFAATATDPIFPPLFVHTTIEPAAPCADSTVYLAVHLADPCLRVVSFSTNVSPPALLVRRASRQSDSCAFVPNLDRRYALGRFAAGQHVYTVRVVVEVPNDSGYAVSWQDRPLSFTVTQGCAGNRPLPYGLQFKMNGATFGGTVAPATCPAVPTTVRFSGYVTNSCERYTGYRYFPSVNGTERDLVLVDFSQRCPDSLAMCLASVEGFRDSVVLPAYTPGARRLEVVVVRHLSCPDSLPRSIASVSYPYTVMDSCETPPPPPPPALLPHGVQVAIGRPAPCDSCPPVTCPNVPVLMKLSAWPENSCVQYTGMRLLPLAGMPDRDVVEIGFRTVCPDTLRPCLMYASQVLDSLWLPGQAPGAHKLEVRVVDVACRDSVLGVASRLLTYAALDSCGGPPPPVACVMPFLQPVRITANADRCDLRLPRGGIGRIAFAVHSEGVRLSGLQGVVPAPGVPLRIERLEAIGAAAGMHLQTERQPDGAMRFVLWADRGAPVPAGNWSPVLNVVVRADSAATAPAAVPVGVAVVAASDSLGTSLPICAIETFAPVVATVCVGVPAPASCDANGDGRTNVADLVRMVRCWFRPDECPDSAAAHPDCNGDGAYTPIDLLCCARGMLGGPRDSTAHRPEALSFAFGEPRVVNGRVELPLTVRGGAELGGALLRFTCPSDRYEWDDGITADGPASMTDTGTDENWAVIRDLDGGDRLLALLRLGETASDVITTTLHLRLRDGQQPGGTVSIAASDLSGADGAPLELDLGPVQVTLPPTTSTTVTRLELSAARPNPTGGPTTFALALPQSGDVDLAIYDLAGRRVATLWRGTLPAGTREFTWNGVAQNGVYFARLVVDGEVRTSRVVLRRLR